MHITIPFQKPEYRNLARRTASSFAFVSAAKVALVYFCFPAHHGRFIADDLLVDGFAKFVKNRIAVLRFTPVNSAAERAEIDAQNRAAEQIAEEFRTIILATIR